MNKNMLKVGPYVFMKHAFEGLVGQGNVVI